MRNHKLDAHRAAAIFVVVFTLCILLDSCAPDSKPRTIASASRTIRPEAKTGAPDRPSPIYAQPSTTDHAQAPAKKWSTVATPAVVMDRVLLSPPSGNGIHPCAAALDARRNRLYVLNDHTRNLAVIDLIRHRQVAVAPVPGAWTAHVTDEQMLYDPRLDRLFILAASEQRSLLLIAMSVHRLKVVGTRDCGEAGGGFTLNSRRGELYLAILQSGNGMRLGVDVLDAKTLRTKRSLHVSGELSSYSYYDGLALAADETTGRLYVGGQRRVMVLQ
jgi:hypothetical protein